MTATKKPPFREYVDAGTSEAAKPAKMRKAPARKVGGKVANIAAARAAKPPKPAAPASMEPSEAIERAAISIMLVHLAEAGFKTVEVFDGRTLRACATFDDAADAILAANEATVMLTNAAGARHGVFLVPGCGADIIGNWSFDDDDADGFGAAMERVDGAVSALAKERAALAA